MIRKHRFLRIFTISAVVSVGIAIGFFRLSAPENGGISNYELPLAQPLASKRSSPEVRPGVVLTDAGEGRTIRLGALEHLLSVQLGDSSTTPAELAATWLALADTCIELEKFARAQEAIEAVRNLSPDQTTWYFREATLLQQELAGWEALDSRQYQLRRDRVLHHQRAQQYFASAEYLEAIRESRAAVMVQRELLSVSENPADGDNARLARELTFLGCLVLEHSDTYGEAAGILQDASKISLFVRGENNPVHAEVLAALARVSDERGDFSAADALYEQCLKILSETRTEMSAEYARVLARQSRMHMDWWKDYGEGKGYRALQIRQEVLGEDHLECAESFEHLGVNALAGLNFQKADELLQKALAIRQRTQGENHPDTSEARNWLSQVYIAQGDVAKASLSLQQAIRLTIRHRGSSHPRLVRLLANVAHLGRDDWNQPRGEREAQRAVRIATEIGTERHPSTFDAMIAMGDLMLEEENPYGLAQLRRVEPRFIAEYMKTVISAHESCPHANQLPSYATSLINLAHVGYWDDYQSVNRDEAQARLNQALANMQQYGYEQHPAYSEYLNVLGRWHIWAGDEETGRAMLKESLRVVEQQYGIVLSERRASAWRSLGGAFMHAGQYTDEMDACLKMVARLDEDIYRQNAAGQCDVDRYCISRARFFSVGVCALHPGVQLSDTERYRQILSTKGSTARLQLSERFLYEKPELKPLFDAVRTKKRHLKSVAYALPKSSEDIETWREALFTAADEKESSERELAIVSRSFLPPMTGLEPQSLQNHLPDNVTLLDFVNYTALGPPLKPQGRLHRVRKMGVFIVSRDKPVEFVQLGDSQTIDEAVTEWVKAVRSSQSSMADVNTLGTKVSQLIWEPIRSKAEGSRILLIAPDGPICFVPFAALPGTRANSFLIEDVTIGYVPSARQWCDLLEMTDAPKINGLLAVGDIEYHNGTKQTDERQMLGLRAFDPSAAAWENLPATRAEAEQVAELMRSSAGVDFQTRLLTGTEPSIDALQAALSERWRYFHFAGHGLFADLQTNWATRNSELQEVSDHSKLTTDEAIVFGRAPQLLSGLILTPPDARERATDSILTADEVASLDLRGTELVVLSACETALGNTVGGEGVLGLQRAFLNAGARSTLSSLWKVEDAATSVLMEKFYSRLADDQFSKWESLRQAQLELLRNPDLIDDRWSQLVSRGYDVPRGLTVGRTKSLESADQSKTTEVSQTHPALWAAFVLYGDGR